mmetsp:Transcript_6688/g.10250  ORF Transcript_6688/g.10250 Transcript_6688/m.10250 type:complete len:375 (-) Transcript_6688:498-1622(-)
MNLAPSSANCRFVKKSGPSLLSCLTQGTSNKVIRHHWTSSQSFHLEMWRVELSSSCIEPTVVHDLHVTVRFKPSSLRSYSFASSEPLVIHDVNIIFSPSIGIQSVHRSVRSAICGVPRLIVHDIRTKVIDVVSIHHKTASIVLEFGWSELGGISEPGTLCGSSGLDDFGICIIVGNDSGAPSFLLCSLSPPHRFRCCNRLLVLFCHQVKSFLVCVLGDDLHRLEHVSVDIIPLSQHSCSRRLCRLPRLVCFLFRCDLFGCQALRLFPRFLDSSCEFRLLSFGITSSGGFLDFLCFLLSYFVLVSGLPGHERRRLGLWLVGAGFCLFPGGDDRLCIDCLLQCSSNGRVNFRSCGFDFDCHGVFFRIFLHWRIHLR